MSLSLTDLLYILLIEVKEPIEELRDLRYFLLCFSEETWDWFSSLEFFFMKI